MACPLFGFAQTRGTQFVVEGQPFYPHGFNAYFLMAISVDLQSRPKATALLEEAAGVGMNLARTWAFNDGGYEALQVAPGVYDEKTFQALDFVISEANRVNVRLILTLVNNWGDYGGKPKYVEWARNAGSSQATSEDAFFTDPTTREFYRNHIKKVVTRVNSINGVAYKDDPTIFAWELMNEPRCTSDPSGNVLQAWIEEMASYVKSLDSNHLVGLGTEGFYGPSKASRLSTNPNSYAGQVGTDFLRNHAVSAIDFAGAHGYPDSWLGSDVPVLRQNSFVENWLAAHISDCMLILKKPFLFGEFGMSSKAQSYRPENRESFLGTVYTVLYVAALGGAGGVGGGGLVWQLFPKGLENYNDGYQIVLSEDAHLSSLIAEQSLRLQDLVASSSSSSFQPEWCKGITELLTCCWQKQHNCPRISK